MRAREFTPEATYPGNIGVAEVFKALQVATPAQKKVLLNLIKRKENRRAWRMIQNLTGTKLIGNEFA